MEIPDSIDFSSIILLAVVLFFGNYINPFLFDYAVS